MESDPHRILDELVDDSRRLAARVAPPRWLYVVFAVLAASYVLGLAFPFDRFVIALQTQQLPFLLGIGCIAYVGVKRQSGVRLSGDAGRESRNYFAGMIGTAVVGGLTGLAIGQSYLSPWWALVPAALVLVGELVLGFRYDSALRRDLANAVESYRREPIPDPHTATPTEAGEILAALAGDAERLRAYAALPWWYFWGQTLAMCGYVSIFLFEPPIFSVVLLCSAIVNSVTAWLYDKRRRLVPDESRSFFAFGEGMIFMVVIACAVASFTISRSEVPNVWGTIPVLLTAVTMVVIMRRQEAEARRTIIERARA